MSGFSWVQDLIEVFLPAGCVVCGSWMPGGPSAALSCARCRSRLRPASWPRCPRCHFPLGTGRAPSVDCLECRAWPPALSGARYAFALDGAAADLVHALKYEGWPELAEEMGDALIPLAPISNPDRVEVVVPIPTTPRRIRQRGYNQAERLARPLARHRGSASVEALVRTTAAASQTALHPLERRANVRGAFAPGPDLGAVHGAHVLLVDDVLTTGATAGAAAEVLLAAGAVEIILIAFARALPDRSTATRAA